MSACCIGGVCLPTQAVVPICILLLRQMYMKIVSWYNQLMGKEIPEETISKKGTCCESNCTSSGRRGKRGKSEMIAPPKLVEDVDKFRSVLQNHEIVVVKFTASWCGPCKSIEPFFVSMYQKCYERMKEKVFFVKVDVDDLDEIAQENKISMMPTFIVFQKGKNIASMSGSNEGDLESFLQKNVLSLY